ncbi:MAG: ECF transporter S component [Eubacteriales bacterium]|nr:ECF transporter S component [Eubacteriales bacterium]
MKLSLVKRSVITAVCIALCVVLPMAFHAVQNAGSIFLPMHIPVLLCGLICGWPFGLLCGLAGPLLSSLLTSMPPMAYLPVMMVELALYGLFTGVLMRLVRTKNLYADLYISLTGALLIGRVLSGVARALIFAPGSYSMAAWAAGYFVTCLPGLAIQLALIPTIVFALEKAHLIPQRYPKEELNEAA